MYNYQLESKKTHENFDYSDILGRSEIQNEITNILSSFDEKCSDVQFKKGIYIYGSPGSGKSTLMNILGCLDHPFNSSLVGCLMISPPNLQL